MSLQSEDVEMQTYEHGALLGCPDCVVGVEHCCPFLWADLLEPGKCAWVLKHMRDYFRDML